MLAFQHTPLSALMTIVVPALEVVVVVVLVPNAEQLGGLMASSAIGIAAVIRVRRFMTAPPRWTAPGQGCRSAGSRSRGRAFAGWVQCSWPLSMSVSYTH